MAAATSIKLVIPSEIRLIDIVHEVSQRLAELAGMGGDDALNLGLAVREGVINAILHGNGRDPARKVEIRIDLATDGAVRARILDQGQGFDPGKAADPTDHAHILNSSGRGLLMMRAFVDAVDFRYRKGRGMELTLTKKTSRERRLAR